MVRWRLEPSPICPKWLWPQAHTVPRRKTNAWAPSALSEIFFASVNGTSSTTRTLVLAELLAGVGSEAEVETFDVALSVTPFPAFTRATTLKMIKVPFGTPPNDPTAVPPSLPAGGVQRNEQVKKLTPVGRVTET